VSFTTGFVAFAESEMLSAQAPLLSAQPVLRVNSRHITRHRWACKETYAESHVDPTRHTCTESRNSSRQRLLENNKKSKNPRRGPTARTSWPTIARPPRSWPPPPPPPHRRCRRPPPPRPPAPDLLASGEELSFSTTHYKKSLDP
jgi:hypothetical protein